MKWSKSDTSAKRANSKEYGKTSRLTTWTCKYKYQTVHNSDPSSDQSPCDIFQFSFINCYWNIYN